MVDEDLKVYTIDFPQMVSSSHPDARFYFERDQTCILTLFKRKFDFVCDRKYDIDEIEVKKRLDAVVKASGFDKSTAKDDLEAYLAEARKQNNEEGVMQEKLEENDEADEDGEEGMEELSEGDEEEDGEEEDGEGSEGENPKNELTKEHAMDEPKKIEEDTECDNEFKEELKAMNLEPTEKNMNEGKI